MTRPLRLMAVLPGLAPGGAEVQLAQLLHGLPREEFECELVTLFSARLDPELERRLNVRALPLRDLAVAPMRDEEQGALHAARNLRRARPLLAARIREFRPDIVYTRLWYAGLTVASLPRRGRFLHVANEENALDNLDDRGQAKRLLRRYVVAQADAWVVPTRGLFDEFVRGGARAGRGTVVYNSTAIPPLPAPRAASAPARFAAMGRLVPGKGFDRLLQAAERARRAGANFRVDVAGEGPERRSLETLARALGVEDVVRFVGYVPDPHAFLAEHDAFLLTSRAEGFANVLVEAMACGLPVVAMDIRYGPNEIVVPGETGFLVPDGDLAGFAARLSELAADPALRARLGRAGRARAEAVFSTGRMVAQFQDVFFRAAGRPRQEERTHVQHSW
ncbi:glycosyltransferase [Deinococcus planocerae]|uniref:glycosyltransferase n=1 Tax=Deinococcus planocerae TaxID=1737569 RepID=UPI000C7EFD51|nr:glycosyltransferase [Deinococcus planocerae]